MPGLPLRILIRSFLLIASPILSIFTTLRFVLVFCPSGCMFYLNALRCCYWTNCFNYCLFCMAAFCYDGSWTAADWLLAKADAAPPVVLLLAGMILRKEKVFLPAFAWVYCCSRSYCAYFLVSCFFTTRLPPGLYRGEPCEVTEAAAAP